MKKLSLVVVLIYYQSFCFGQYWHDNVDTDLQYLALKYSSKPFSERAEAAWALQEKNPFIRIDQSKVENDAGEAAWKCLTTGNFDWVGYYVTGSIVRDTANKKYLNVVLTIDRPGWTDSTILMEKAYNWAMRVAYSIRKKKYSEFHGVLVSVKPQEEDKTFAVAFRMQKHVLRKERRGQSDSN